MYVATKQFESFEEAVKEIFLSDSLAQSDLRMFLGEDVKDFKTMNDAVSRIYEELKEDKYDRTNYPEMWDDAFSYTTYSGINSVRLAEIRDESGEKIEGYLCEYSVESDKPLEYSSAMRRFKEAGWFCEDPHRTPEEQEEFRNQYEQGLIEELRAHRTIPGIDFKVNFLDEQPAYITSHYISNDSYTIQTLLQNHPELSDEIIEIINEQIKTIDSVAVPTTYDFNESVYENSNFYVEKREEIKQTLSTIRDELLKKKLASKESELSSLEVEEKTIAEAESLIDKQTAKEGQGIGEN